MNGFIPKGVSRNIVHLLKDHILPSGESLALKEQKASVLTVGVRVVTSHTIEAIIEEKNGDQWQVTDTTEMLEGETVVHHPLKHSVFRVRLKNPSPTNDAVVTVDVDLPRKRSIPEDELL
ncbi:MAG: hypothetical protein H0Z39_04125 [Peptococcaceae bacterium]|nr:hypothetical protein [Peptococcaceae bacterium]